MTPQDTPPPEPGSPRRRARRRWWRGALVVVAALVVWGAVDAALAAGGLRSAAADASRVRDLVLAGDVTAAAAVGDDAARDARRARSAAHRLPLTLAQALPLVGDDVTALRDVADAAAGIATDALPGVLDAVGTLDHLAAADGRVDVAAIAAAAPAVTRADDAVRHATAVLEGIGTGGLVGPVADGVTRARDAVADIAPVTAAAGRAARVVPSMLGADGPRDYLVLVQTNAELRAAGGIPGALLQVHVADGTFEIVDQRGADEVNGPDADVLPLTPAEGELFGDQLGRYVQDVTLTPHFPRTAELARAMWERATGVSVDGVLAIDPVVLQLVVAATGDVRLPDGTVLTGEGTARTLLHDVYLRVPDPTAQDAWFAVAAQAVLDQAVRTAPSAPRELLDALGAATAQRRVLLWSAHEDEQSLLAATSLAGAVTGRDGPSPVVGVYLNDGSAAKMSWFLEETVSARETCTPRGRRVEVTLTMRSTAPTGGAGLPRYVTGAFLPAGDVRTGYDLYAPYGGLVEQVVVDGEPTEVFHAAYLDLDVASWTAQLAPGERTTVVATMTVPDGLTGPVLLSRTPTAHPAAVPVVGRGGGCGAGDGGGSGAEG
ncbi:DUF4012 domain-containing protein [Cellulomonas sp. DKR-3]|uniref:DUF4012 domain-containing protein n=1 Tax=Cellulomonas fulva TaxID=2835530 RepID=A0ABS5TVB7_9CELL|nr:DUF4012 domain-containing protein [Cellulomonas fulva]MBT0993093.1 DUF4012 domain-containing protein [Cellulomonas fulva]